jgi:glutaredoxin
MLNFLRQWWPHPSAGSLERLHFFFYTRKGCHLCEAAWETLRAEQRRSQFKLTPIDVDTDPALAERYGDQVPVVVLEGKVRFRGGINRVLLARLLRAEGGRRGGEGAGG